MYRPTSFWRVSRSTSVGEDVSSTEQIRLGVESICSLDYLPITHTCPETGEGWYVPPLIYRRYKGGSVRGKCLRDEKTRGTVTGNNGPTTRRRPSVPPSVRPLNARHERVGSVLDTIQRGTKRGSTYRETATGEGESRIRSPRRDVV